MSVPVAVCRKEKSAVTDEWNDKWPRYYTWDESLQRIERNLLEGGNFRVKK